MKSWVKWVLAGAVVTFLLAAGAAVFVFRYRKQIEARVMAELARKASHAAAKGSAEPKSLEAVKFDMPPVPTSLPFVGPEGDDEFGYPKKIVSGFGMVTLLRYRRYRELTHYCEELEQQAESDVGKENWADDAIGAFARSDPELGPLLDEWVKAFPNSFAPFAARAEYHSAVGVHYRGSDFMSKTSPAELEALDRELELSKADAERAIALQPKSRSAYFTLIDNGRHHGTSVAAFQRAEPLFPASFRLYYDLMDARTPRWGGSYPELRAIAGQGAKQVAKNPKLKLLPAFVDAALAEDRMTLKDYNGALVAMNSALKLGDHSALYSQRGTIKGYLADYEGALADYDKSLELRPESGAIFSKAWVLYKQRRYEESANTYLTALRFFPTGELQNRKSYAGAFTWVGNHYFNLGRPVEALAAYDRALFLVPGYADAARWRAELLRRGNPTLDPAELAAATKHAEQDDTLEAYLALDAALARRGRFGEVTDHWSHFIARHPDVGRAYLERGGAYTRFQHFREAGDDAQKACDLGNQEGCRFAPQARDRERKMGAPAAEPAPSGSAAFVIPGML